MAYCHLLGFFSNVNSLPTSPPDAPLLYLPISGDVTTHFLSHHTHVVVSRTVTQNPHLTKSANIFNDWATILFPIKEIPHCYYNYEFFSHDLEDLRLSIDVYTSILTSIRMSA